MLLFILSTNTLIAQSVSIARIVSDESMKDYVWAIGYGSTLEEADKDAMNTLVSYTISVTRVDKGVLTESEEKFKQELVSMSDIYLENVRREVLPDKNEQKRVLRYISKNDWENKSGVLRGKIQEYIDSGVFAPMIEDKIRYFAWAYVLLHTYHDETNPIMIEGKPAKAYLYETIREGLNNISIEF